MKSLCLLIFPLVFFQQSGMGSPIGRALKVQIDPAYLNKNQLLTQDVFYTADSNFSGVIQIVCYKYAGSGDSTIMYTGKNVKVAFKKGLNCKVINFIESDTNSYFLPDFYNIYKATSQIPAGTYKTFARVYTSIDTQYFDFVHEIDSALSISSKLYQEILSSHSPRQRKFLGIKIHSDRSTSEVSLKSIRAIGKIDKRKERLFKAKGLTPIQFKRNDKNFTALYYNDWFVSQYETQAEEPILNKVSKRGDFRKINTGAFENDDLEDNQSAFSKMRKEKTAKKEASEVKGEISLSANLSSGQEQYAATDNNYYELRGRFELPVKNMPVEIDGLYTSQDAHRAVKAGYIRFHYDAEKAKENLLGSINSYKKKVAETHAKQEGLERIYISYINNLESQKSQLQSEARNAKNKGQINSKDINTKDAITAEGGEGISKIGGSAGAPAIPEGKANISKDTTREKIEAFDRKIERYKRLLAQYKNSRYFDSVYAASKLKNLDNLDDKSYKQLAAKADNLLPDGNSKNFLSGITHFDAGMFPKYQSKYTMSGQMLKGADVGYDFKLFKTGFTMGQTQYIGRDGSVDKFTCYSGGLFFNPIEKEQIGVVYYGYTPSRSMFSGDGFFKNVDLAAPSFRQPVHIISINYAGDISQYVQVKAEAASSFKAADTGRFNDRLHDRNEKLAYSFELQGNIPSTTISLEGKYDKTGRNFENATIPVSLAGTEQYKLGAKADFFNSFLSTGLEYDYLVQNNFAGRSNSTKWGFSLSTHSRRYPSFSLSYKPFATFRSVTDTLAIPQRPMIGSVFGSRASYQIKRKDRSWRFLALYSVNASTMDTFSYHNTLLQFAGTYAINPWLLTATGGMTQMRSSNQAALTPGQSALPGKTIFWGLSGSYVVNKQCSVSGGEETGYSNLGLSRLCLNAGVVFKPEILPLALRLSARFNTYSLDDGQGWKKIYSCLIDITWNFRSSLSRKTNY